MSAREILFVPDRNLGAWTQCVTGRQLILWEGFCPTHEFILAEQVQRARALHPEALVVAHPECNDGVRALADHIASTSGMLAFCRKSDHPAFIIATERGILHRLRLDSPGKQFYAASPEMTCPNMKYATVEKILRCLEDLTGEVNVAADTANGARQAIERMLMTAQAAGQTK